MKEGAGLYLMFIQGTFLSSPSDVNVGLFGTLGRLLLLMYAVTARYGIFESHSTASLRRTRFCMPRRGSLSRKRVLEGMAEVIDSNAPELYFGSGLLTSATFSSVFSWFPNVIGSCHSM